MVDRVTQLEHLAQAERLAVQGWSLVEQQRERVAKLEQDGHDTMRAKKTLATFEQTQQLHEQHLKLVKSEVGGASCVQPSVSRAIASVQISLGSFPPV